MKDSMFDVREAVDIWSLQAATFSSAATHARQGVAPGPTGQRRTRSGDTPRHAHADARRQGQQGRAAHGGAPQCTRPNAWRQGHQGHDVHSDKLQRPWRYSQFARRTAVAGNGGSDLEFSSSLVDQGT